MSPSLEISQNSRSAVRILVADADDETRLFYRESLRPTGCDVVDAIDGRDALVKALVHAPTLVITDTQLPIFDGYALCEVLRRDSTTRTVPILVVTADTRPSDMSRARDVGADAVLTKPVAPDTLLNEIQRLLERRPAQPSPTAGGPSSDPPYAQRRTAPVKAELRGHTTTPLAPAPDLVCPECDRPLTYECSHIGGVRNEREQWDRYCCPSACGTYEYRQRTRTLRRVG